MTAKRKCPKTNPFVEFVLSQLAELGQVRARAMFGGWGIYQRDVMFALIAYDRLYLKADDQNRGDFEAADSEPFRYEKKGGAQSVVMSYWEAPLAVLESPPRLCQWARAACEAAMRGQSRSSKRKGGGK